MSIDATLSAHEAAHAAAGENITVYHPTIEGVVHVCATEAEKTEWMASGWLEAKPGEEELTGEVVQAATEARGEAAAGTASKPRRAKADK